MNKSYYISQKRINNRITGIKDFLGMQRFSRIVGVIVLLLALLSTVFVQGQTSPNEKDCDLSFEYEVQHTSGKVNNGVIYLTRLEGTGPFTIGLYDLLSGKQEFDVTKHLERIPRQKKIKIFEDVAAGTYLIRVENGTCSRSLSDIEGIEVK